METWRGHRQPAGGLPPQIERDRLDRLAVRQPVQGLQHDHRGDHVRRDREQIGEQLIGEQLPPMPGQEREHPTRRQQVPGHRLDIQDLALRISPSLHHHIVPTTDSSQGSTLGLFSAVLVSCA
jgi:hypothetical protein